MRKSVVTKALVAAVSNGIAHSQSLAAAGPLVLVSNPVVLDSQRRVILTSAADDSALTWTVIGTDDNGNLIKDSFLGANTPTVVQSNIDFKTVISISSDRATAGAVIAGTNGVGSSPWQLFSDTIATPNLSINYQLISGSQNATVEYTYDGILPDPTTPKSAIALGPNSPNPQVIPHPVLQAMAASKDGIINWAITGWRLTINSGTGVGQMTSRQAGLASP